MIRYSIKDLEKLSGIKAHTIRIWEKRYQLIQPSRTLTNIRYYSDEDLKRILNIAILNKNGFRISNIITMTDEEVKHKLVEISEDDSTFVHEVESLVLAMIEMDESRFDKVLSSSIVKYGFEKTMTVILSKFLGKIGVLWQTGTISPAQEHFVSNLIRQKLILAIDSQHVPVYERSKVFLLFLPEQEYHEMALLYFHYLIKKAGHQVIYLGQNVPLNDLIKTTEIKHIDFVFTSITCALSDQDLQLLLDRLSVIFTDKQILVGGMKFSDFSPKLPKNIRHMNAVEEVEKFLTQV